MKFFGTKLIPILIFIILSIQTVFSQRIPRATLVAHYPLDGHTRDLTENTYNGTPNGVVPTSDRFGNTSSAYEFDGENDFIQLPIDIGPKTLPVMTVTMWAKSNKLNGRSKVFSHDDNGYDRTIGLDDRGGGEGWSAFCGSGEVLGYHPVNFREWTFLAVIYDQEYDGGKDGKGLTTLYVNDDTLYQKIGVVGNGYDYVYLGANPPSSNHFSGAIDDVRIYDGALTVAQINALYNEENPNTNIPPEVAWSNHFSGIYNNVGGDIDIISSDGGFIIGGTSTEEAQNQNKDIKLVRTDSLGNMAWIKTFGTDENEVLNTIIATDLGFIATGLTSPNLSSPVSSMYITYINREGEEVWARTFGDSTSAYDIVASEPGKFLVLGGKRVLRNGFQYLFDSDVWIMEINESGNMLWEKYFGGKWEDFVGSLTKTFDDGYLLSGGSETLSGVEYGRVIWLLRLDNTGEVLWSETYGDGTALAACETEDRGFAVIYGDDNRNFLLRVDSNGNELWRKEYWGNFSDVRETEDGAFLLLGRQDSFDWLGNGGEDIWLIKTDAAGETIWTKSIGEAGDDTAREFKPTNDGGYIIVGSTTSYNNSDKDEIYIVKIAPEVVETSVSESNIEHPSGFALSQNYPNPFNPETKITFTLPQTSDVKIEIFNITGQKITTLIEKKMGGGSHSITFVGTQLSSGVYFYKITTGSGFSQTRKMLLMK